MLKSLRLRNYKCFLNSSIVFKSQAILVGKNNAGKSTLIEALRLVSMSGKKATCSVFSLPLAMYGFPIDYKGIRLDTDKLKIDLRNAIYFYDDTYATIEAIFDDQSKIEIYINTDVAFAVFFDCEGENIWKKDRVARCSFSKISIMPQIGPIRENEKILLKETILNDKETYLSSRHFRNELNYYKKDKYADFKALSEDTWDGLKILGLEQSGEFLSLMVQDSYFPCEIGLMGSGIQIWLQFIWFLCKSEEATTLIFDEPDIYMHPDLQIRLFKILQQRNIQIIIATHSVEIISQTEPKYLAYIDKSTREIKYANSSKGVQKVIDDIGGISNLSLIKIGQIKKCLFLEGKDIEVLGPFANKVYPKIEPSIESFPQVQLEGKRQLSEAYGAAKIFFTEACGDIKCIAIINRDYDDDSICKSLINIAQNNSLELIIWKRKEIDNYLLNPNVLFRTIKGKGFEYSVFLNQFTEIIESYRDEVEEQYVLAIHNEDKSQEVSTCIEKARLRIQKGWTTLENKLEIVPGKKVLTSIRDLLRIQYGTSCSNKEIVNQFRMEEIHQNIIDALRTIYSM